MFDPYGEEVLEVIVDGICTAEDGGKEVGPKGVLDRCKERSNIRDSAADVLPFGQKTGYEASVCRVGEAEGNC